MNIHTYMTYIELICRLIVAICNLCPCYYVHCVCGRYVHMRKRDILILHWFIMKDPVHEHHNLEPSIVIT